MTIEKIKIWDYEWERQMTFFIADSIFLAWKIPSKKYAIPLKYYFLLGKKDQAVDLYMGSEEIYDVSERLVDRFLKDKLTELWVKSCESDCGVLEKFIENKLIKTDLNSLTDSDLIKIFKEFYKVYVNVVCHIVVIRELNRSLQQRLENYFQNDFKATDGMEVLNVLTTPEQLSIDAVEEIDFLHLIKKIKINKTETNKLIKKHLGKYKWMPVGYLDEKEWDIKYLLSRIKDFNRKKMSVSRRIKEIKGNLDKVKVGKRNTLKKYRLPSQILRLCDQSAHGAYYKDLIRARLNLAHYYSRPLFTEIARRNGLTFKKIKMLGHDDIVNIFRFSKNTLENKIQRRRKGYLLMSVNGVRKEIYSKREIIKFQKDLETPRGSLVLKGTGVSLGNVSGKVLKITKQTINNKAKNYILVTTMTTPELVPLMKNAIAVVTDEGGLTCHAAIVSRELKIPCVVGTKNATKILQDGDFIEVDANKGIVKIVKK